MQPGTPPLPRYWVRVGTDVRGPVDEPTIAAWIAQGMLRAEICAEGGAAYVALEHTPFARYLPVAETSRHGIAKKSGAIAVVALLLLFGRAARVCNQQTHASVAQIEASLPAVGAQGELLRADGPLRLCPAGSGALWGWPCGSGKSRTIAPGSRVQIAKVGVFQVEGLCRYWVQGGPDDRFVGDAPCAWFKPG
jgi:hypothetical protein